MKFADLALSRRLESAEAMSGEESARTMMRLRPERGAAVLEIAGGFAVFAGINSPITQAVGLGLNGPVGEEEMDRLEEFYRSRGDGVRVELSPHADMSIVKHFARRGYRVAEFSNVLVCPLDPGESFHVPPQDILVERVEEKDVNLWTRTVAQGFAEHFPVTPEILEIMDMFAHNPGAQCFLARIGGEPAGGAAFAIHDGVAGIFGASTLPAFRRRGVQKALVEKRLSLAAAAGCELAMTVTQPGSGSQRNVERQRFQVVYTRVKFSREWA